MTIAKPQKKKEIVCAKLLRSVAEISASNPIQCIRNVHSIERLLLKIQQQLVFAETISWGLSYKAGLPGLFLGDLL